MAQFLSISFVFIFCVFAVPAFAQETANESTSIKETKLLHKAARKEAKREAKAAKSEAKLAHEKEIKELEERNKALEVKSKEDNKKILAEKKAKAAADKHIYDEKLKKEKDDAGQTTEERIKKTDDEEGEGYDND